MRDYIYLDMAISLCSRCLRRVSAKVIRRDDNVYMQKQCLACGDETVLIATDAAYYQKCRSYYRAGETTKQFHTKRIYGCPYDCGLCPDHEQHACISIIEVTERCNLRCPTCYAESGPNKGRHRTLAEIERMLDVVVASEGEPDVVQLSGGEPTIHPDFFAIMDAAKARPIRHLMVNTNGIRLASDREFAGELAKYKPGIEVYLQFDSLEAKALRHLRGADLRAVRTRALAALDEYDISTTLVVTLAKGINDHEIGAIIEEALKHRSVRGVTFQPTQAAGRLDHFDPEKDRLTLTEVRQQILKQAPLFTEKDIVPIPCHPEGVAVGYAVKVGGQALALSQFTDPETIISQAPDTISFERAAAWKQTGGALYTAGPSPARASSALSSLLCCHPQIDAAGLDYGNVFRVAIVQFFDAYNFDLRPIKKTCIQIVTDDGRMVPFDTMNLLYRDGGRRLEELRREVDSCRG